MGRSAVPSTGCPTSFQPTTIWNGGWMCRFVTARPFIKPGGAADSLLAIKSKIFLFRNWFGTNRNQWLIHPFIYFAEQCHWFLSPPGEPVSPNQFCLNGCFTRSFSNLNQPSVHQFPALFLWQLASRSLHQQLVPMVTLHVSLMNDSDSVSSTVLQTEPSTLLHLISTLEAALETSKTSHARRMLRSI